MVKEFMSAAEGDLKYFEASVGNVWGMRVGSFCKGVTQKPQSRVWNWDKKFTTEQFLHPAKNLPLPPTLALYPRPSGPHSRAPLLLPHPNLSHLFHSPLAPRS